MFRFFRSLLAIALFLAAAAPALPAQTAAPIKPSSAKTPAVADAGKLDLNTATPVQLKALKGIGDAYAKRIVDGRPYTAKNQLTTRGILPGATYEGIKDQIIARNPKK